MVRKVSQKTKVKQQENVNVHIGDKGKGGKNEEHKEDEM